MTRTLALSLGRAFGLVAVGAALLVLSGADAFAQDPDPVQLFDEGNALYREGNFQAAEAKFQRSFNLKPVFDVAANLGDCEIEIGQHREAAEHLAFAVKNFPVTGGADVRAQLEARFREAAAKVGALTVQPNVAGAAIAIDGTKIGDSPLGRDVYVDPGPHTITATKDGYERASAEVTATAGEKQAVGLTLKLLEDDGAGGAGGEPGGEEEGWTMVPAWVMGGLGLVGIGIGAGLYVAAGGTRDDTKALSDGILADGGVCMPNVAAGFESRCAELDDNKSSIEGLENGGTASFVVGGTLLVGALTYLLFAPSGADGGDEQALTVRMWAGPDSGVRLEGSF